MKQPIPINQAEAVFERFYDSARSGLAQWAFSCDNGTGGAKQQEWQAAAINWRRGGGKVVGRLSRRLNLDVSGYSHFMIRCNLAASCSLTVRAATDGKKRTVLCNIAGQNEFYDFEGRLPGKCLQSIEIEVRAEESGPGGAAIFWLGLFDQAQRDRARARPSPYDGKWEGLIRPVGEVKRFTPQLELFFGNRELAAIRRKVARPYYREVMAKLRQTARGYLGAKPHKHVGEYPVSPGSGRRYSRTYALGIPQNERISPAMFTCAFVGLIDQDERLLRTALSHALAAAHCTYWDDSHMMTIPGGCWDHRAFKAAALTHWFVRAWDWAGSLLTEAGVTVMARAISLKALPLFLMSLERHGYMRHCNQAIIFAVGALNCHAALARVWDYGEERLDVALAALSETVVNYTEPDGGAHEGLGYFNWSYATALEGYIVAARIKGKDVREIVPKCVLKTPAYLKNILSTAEPVDAGIAVADGGKPGKHGMDMLSRLMLVCDDPEIRAMWAMARRVHEKDGANGDINDILFGPARLPKAKTAAPVFSLLRHTGMLCSNRPVAGGSVRLQVIGASADAGHTHQDKGSFVLEAFGEEILIDRGICIYCDIRALSMKRADQHNMITPNDSDGVPLAAICPCPEAMLPTGKGDRTALRARIDGSAQWTPHFKKWVRTITSETPQTFVVADAIERRSKGTVSFHLQSRFPWQAKDGAWVSVGKKSTVRVVPAWTPAASVGREDGCDGALQPVYRLTLTTAADTAFRLQTEIVVTSKAK